MRALDNPHRIARLVRALEAFLEADSDTAFRIAPELHGGPVEVFAVPPPADVVEFLRWAGEARRIAARSRGGTR